MVGLSDANILGWGNKLKLMTNFSRKDFSYGGNMVEYEIPQRAGELLHRGVRRRARLLQLDARHGAAQGVHQAHRLRDRPHVQRHQIQTLHGRAGHLAAGQGAEPRRLGGYSRYLRRIGSSVYLTGRYNYRRVSRRPLVGPHFNPALHDQDALLVGAGLYREKNSTRPT